MKGYIVAVMLCLVVSIFAHSQTIPSKKLTSLIKGKTDFYISTCEQFYAITGEHNYYETRNFDSCSIPLWKYDLKGTYSNDSLNWEFIKPKKYTELRSAPIPLSDTIQLYVPTEPIVITTNEDWKLFIQSNEIPLNLTIDFNQSFVVFENVWMDCQGKIKHRIEFDPIEKKIICNRFYIYGGSRGMCTRPNLIQVKKTIPNPTIEVRRFNIR